MNNRTQLKTYLLIAVIPLSIMAKSLSGLEELSKAMQNGDAKQVAEYFAKMVEMDINGNEGTYSKSQAEQVLKDFFSNNKPLKFEFQHDGTSGGNNAYYAIGILKTETSKFRVSIYMKKNGDTFIIQELSIQNE